MIRRGRMADDHGHHRGADGMESRNSGDQLGLGPPRSPADHLRADGQAEYHDDGPQGRRHQEQQCDEDGLSRYRGAGADLEFDR